MDKVMTDPLPPLAAIRVFEATARLLSFTAAAAELGMTQAAVSYQIKLLEERLGAPLFLRRPRALALTEAGAWLGKFQLQHPIVAVRMETTQRRVDFSREEVDVVIRSGKGKWEGLSSLKLVDVRFTPIFSPQLAATVGGLKTHEDLLTVPLLDPIDPWWDHWFERHQLPLR